MCVSVLQYWLLPKQSRQYHFILPGNSHRNCINFTQSGNSHHNSIHQLILYKKLVEWAYGSLFKYSKTQSGHNFFRVSRNGYTHHRKYSSIWSQSTLYYRNFKRCLVFICLSSLNCEIGASSMVRKISCLHRKIGLICYRVMDALTQIRMELENLQPHPAVRSQLFNYIRGVHTTAKSMHQIFLSSIAIKHLFIKTWNAVTTENRNYCTKSKWIFYCIKKAIWWI